jgi:glycosyltransferase involved in cell wall biosynthesis
MAMSQPSDQIPEAERPYAPDRLPYDASRHLGLPQIAVREDDRDLAQGKAVAPCTQAHLDLEGVPFGADSIEIDGFENGAAETLEATGGVGDGQSGDPSRVQIGRVGEQEAGDGPVHDRDPAVEVPGAENEVVLAYRGEELWQVGGVVGEVRVHLEDGVVVASEGPPKAFDVGGSQAELPRPVQHVEARLLAGELIGYLSRAIGGRVIDDEDVEPGVLFEDERHQPWQVVAFVVRGYDDERPFQLVFHAFLSWWRPPPSLRRSETTLIGGRLQVKVLYIVTAYDRHAGDGITPWLVETIRRLGDRGVDVEVLAPSYRGLGSGRVDGVMVHRFRYAPGGLEDLTHDQTAPDRVRERPAYLGLLPGYAVAGSVAAARVARSGGFDLVHVHWPLPQALLGWAARTAASIPLICSFYGVELTLARTSRVPMLRPFLRRAIRTADAVTAISTYTTGLVKDVYDRPVELIPFGATIPIPDEIPPSPVSSAVRLLFVGRLVERKGVGYLLDALARARGRGEEVVLDVVGQGPSRASLEAHASSLGVGDVVRFHGFVSEAELIRRYVDCDVFVLPAVVDAKGDVEGLGVVIIEALAYGRGVIASDAGGITDIVEHERTGLLVPPGDADALADAIVDLSRDRERAARLGRAGRAHVQEHFSWPAVIGKLTELYGRVKERGAWNGAR